MVPFGPPVLAISVLDLLGVAGQFLLATLICFVLIALLASYFRFQHITSRSVAEAEEAAEEDLLTLRILERMGTVTREPPPFSVWIFEATWQGEGDPDDEAWNAAVLRLRECIRESDFAGLYGEGRLGMVVDVPIGGTEAVARRVLDAFAEKSLVGTGAATWRVSLRGGAACFPEDGQKAAQLVEAAEAVLDARAEDAADLLLASPPTDAAADDEEEEAIRASQKGLLDELTGVLRPERVEGAVQKYVARSRKNQEPVSLLYMDVDQLDRYNDHYGTEAGDAILRSLGSILEKEVREEDLIGRIGGDEFILVLPCPPDRAIHAAQRLCGRIRRRPFTLGSTRLKVSASVGVAGYPDHGAVARQLFEAAEAALQASKRKGRGTCLMYSSSMPLVSRDSRAVDSF